MGDRSELRRRFERIGRRPTRRIPRVEPPAPEVPDGLPFGEEIATARGSAYRMEVTFPIEHEHGRWPLHAALGYEPGLAADVAQQSGLTTIRPDQLVYLDTETTGLAGGGATL